MQRSPGYCPSIARGKRVRGILANGAPFGSPAGWPADGKAACRWTRTGHPFDIEQYEVVQ